jgi:hypothetical protein
MRALSMSSLVDNDQVGGSKLQKSWSEVFVTFRSLLRNPLCRQGHGTWIAP